ncbi:MAG: STAS domain-containing protein [Candidatus Acidiferrales bacterium]
MKLLSTCRDAGDVAVVDFTGQITLGEGSAALRKMTKELLASGKRKILFNLSEVDYIDSGGLGELVAAYTAAQNAGGELKLANLTTRVRGIIQITRLYTVFDVHPDERSALSKFRETA